jgi:hypothetical protein
MPDDTEAANLRARLEAIIKEAEGTEVQASAACRHVQAACLLFTEESMATALEQTATAACQRVPSSPSSASSVAAASPLVPTASVFNVRQLVNIILGSSSTNYSCWRDLMEQALQRYALLEHVTDDTPSTNPGWIWMILLIIYGPLP